MTTLMKSWVAQANDPSNSFPLNNLPYGVFDDGNGARCGVAIGDQIVDVAATQWESATADLFSRPNWNAFMAAGSDIWAAFRAELQVCLAENSARRAEITLVPMAAATLLMPIEVMEFTDFYAGRNHATNVGTMFRGAENALPPNWLHMPIGYNGRASSVVVSGTPVKRPTGQVKPPDQDTPVFAASKRFDFELELGAIVGQPSDGPISVQQADDNIFGYVLLNDWSARDIQAWEYRPLGPFQGKATATSISPWIVTKAALEPFRVSTPPRAFELLDYIKDCGPMLYNVDLSVGLTPKNGDETIISRTNYSEMYYSSAQQLAHHTVSGCPMRVGDLLGSGTVSGPNRSGFGSMLELSWGGKTPLSIGTETRSFLEDGDAVTLYGQANGDGYVIGFGACSGEIVSAS